MSKAGERLIAAAQEACRIAEQQRILRSEGWGGGMCHLGPKFEAAVAALDPKEP